MSTIENAIDVIVKQGMLPLYFNADENKSVAILKSLYNSGIRAVEYTSRGPEAISNFNKLIEVRNAELPGMLLGIGTIKNLAQAETYYLAGADFFISPGFVPEVASFLIGKEVLYAPGCMTPTEIIAAENAGVKFIKLFPGNILGPDFMSGIRDVFPDLIFMPTGGVDTTSQSIETWFNAGVSAVGMGSKLISKKVMQEEAYDAIGEETKRVLELIESIRK